ncbi:hypothetical protein K438DRAFT_1947199 [Mycena galopus ATCC 62051]|nr:hypothetical protein K438DRAFT_1947199 [Mycena galopus ATCC 62051]
MCYELAAVKSSRKTNTKHGRDYDDLTSAVIHDLECGSGRSSGFILHSEATLYKNGMWARGEGITLTLRSFSFAVAGRGHQGPFAFVSRRAQLHHQCLPQRRHGSSRVLLQIPLYLPQKMRRWTIFFAAIPLLRLRHGVPASIRLCRITKQIRRFSWGRSMGDTASRAFAVLTFFSGGSFAGLKSVGANGSTTGEGSLPSPLTMISSSIEATYAVAHGWEGTSSMQSTEAYSWSAKHSPALQSILKICEALQNRERTGRPFHHQRDFRALVA